ncbi:MAG: hypothetical protein JNM70_00100 [Anaerolineae bacterium]|nr:hypothetical protein [Anaerolineae bacterium]
MRILYAVWIASALALGWGGRAAAQEIACPEAGTSPSGLTAQVWAQITSGETHNLRAEPSRQATVLRQIPDRDIFRTLGDATCAEGLVWWPVGYAGLEGWLAEGDPRAGSVWLTPLEPVAQPSAAADEPEGCLQPPEVYERVSIGYGVLNLRTLAMLDQAQALYRERGGILDFRRGVMQGSYNPGGVSASFGTHDGGGAVDLSVRDPASGNILRAEIPDMIAALRTAGFAAWLRDAGELYAGSPIHIHAIAIGDAELSEAARGQIDGTFGYLRGFNGLPQTDGVPLPDTSGEVIVCGWMRAVG